MLINGVEMDKACDKKFDEYVQEIETKNKCKIPEEEKKQAKNIFAAGYSACLEVVLSTQKK
jgi:hypothetical protein